jgi:phage protein
MSRSYTTTEVGNWLGELDKDGDFKNQETFARAVLDGYTVEEEKRYRVRVKVVCFNGCLIFEKINKTWLFSSVYEIDHQRGSHTRKELEDAGFGEVFNSPLFEVEEV